MPSHTDKRKKRIMHKFRIGEISSVDRPAQSGALSVIMKREKGGRDTIEKNFENAVITLPDDTGHSHLLSLEGRVGETSWSPDADNNGHDHPFMINSDGTVTIGEMLNHSHEVESLEVVAMLTTLASARMMEDSIGAETMVTMKQYLATDREEFITNTESLQDGSFVIKNAIDLEIALKALPYAKDKSIIAQHIVSRADALALTKELEVLKSTIVKDAAYSGGSELETIMTQTTDAATQAAEEVQKKLDAVTAELESSKVALAKADAVATMNDAERTHYETLGNDAQVEFLAKSFDERNSILVEKASGNSIVYTAVDGTEYRKNDDSRLVTLAKQNDEHRAQLQQSLDIQKNMEFQKRAESELASLPGSIETHVAILKAIDNISDEDTRVKALDVLKANNAKMSEAFQVVGSSVVSKGTGGNAVSEMEERSKSYAKEHGVDYFEAYQKVGEQDPQLLAKAVNS